MVVVGTPAQRRKQVGIDNWVAIERLGRGFEAFQADRVRRRRVDDDPGM
jgi:hypothetical protein